MQPSCVTFHFEEVRCPWTCKFKVIPSKILKRDPPRSKRMREKFLFSPPQRELFFMVIGDRFFCLLVDPYLAIDSA
jgi:hypothetical protein